MYFKFNQGVIIKKIIFVLILFSLISTSYAQAIQEVWLGVYKYDKNSGVYQDPLGGTFEGDESYTKDTQYYYSVINYVMDDGTVKRQVIKLSDSLGDTYPAPTAVLDVEYPDGPTDTFFKQTTTGSNTQTVPQTSIPQVVQIPLGSTINLALNDNFNDNDYKDGRFSITISENGEELTIDRTMTSENPGFFHNNSVIIFDKNTGEFIEIPMTSQVSGSEINDTLSIDIKNAVATVKNNLNNATTSTSLYPILNPLRSAKTTIKLPGPIYANILSVFLIIFIFRNRLIK